MSEDDFPFEQFIEKLQQCRNNASKCKPILSQIAAKNMYWTYSALETVFEIINSKDESPLLKLNSLFFVKEMLDIKQYHCITLIQIYILPKLFEIASFRCKKTDEAMFYYFTQNGYSDRIPNIKQVAHDYVLLSLQLIFYWEKIKIYRTCQTEEIEENSQFVNYANKLRQKGTEINQFKICTQDHKQSRKQYLIKLRKFEEASQIYGQFFLHNILEEIKGSRKENIELKQLLIYGDCFLTSLVINYCEDQLNDMTDRIDLKRKYLGLLNQMARSGDIEAIIAIKNSQFVPTIAAQLNNVNGQVGIQKGQNIYPDINSKRQEKKQFYCDFLRCIQTWAQTFPPLYDSDQFTLPKVYHFIKIQRKFKFPENMHLVRYKKQMQENLIKNKKRNEKLIQLLQNDDSSRYNSIDKSKSRYSKASNILGKTLMKGKDVDLEKKIDQIKNIINTDLTEDNIKENMTSLQNFRQNWIHYLDNINVDDKNIDQEKLECIILDGQKFVERIQSLAIYYQSFNGRKISFQEYKKKYIEITTQHKDISMSQNALQKLALSKSISMNKSGMGKSLLSKMKKKNNYIDKSSFLDKSKSYKNLLKRNRSQKDQTYLSNSSKQSLKKELEQQSVYKLQKKAKYIQKVEKSREQSISGSLVDNKSKGKARNNSSNSSYRQHEEPTQKIIKVSEYQNQVQENKTSQIKRNTSIRSSRSRNSRFLERRQDQRQTYKQKRSKIQNLNSRMSQDRKSTSRSKVIKESSIHQKQTFKEIIQDVEEPYKKKQVQLKRSYNELTPKQSILKDNINYNESIQINGINLNQSKSQQKKSRTKQILSNQLSKFKHESDDISSIHTNSNMKVFHNSAEKILDISQKSEGNSRSLRKDGSYLHRKSKLKQVKQEKEIKSSKVLPMVADYYEGQIGLKSNTRKDEKQSSIRKDTTDRNDIIQDHQLSPMRKSFHKDQKNFGKYLKPEFKQIFGNNQVIQSRQKQQNFIRGKKEDTFKNIITKNTKPKSEKILVLQQYEKMKQLSLKEIETVKNNEIQALKRKVYELENETIKMRTKLAAKDNELKSIRSKSNRSSQKNFAQFTSPSHSNFGLSGPKTNSERNSIRSKQKSGFKYQIEGSFKQYLERIKGNTFRKSLLKQKCLIHKTDQIEVGCMSIKNEKGIDVTLYVTPQRYDLMDFTITLIGDQSLKIRHYPEQIKTIYKQKQQKIHVVIQILRIPFCLPQFEINYKSSNQYNTNYCRLAFPLSFNKFCHIEELPVQEFNYIQENCKQISKTDEFKPNFKVIKLQKIKDSFPNFQVLMQKQKTFLLGSKVQIFNNKFAALVYISEKAIWIQGLKLLGDIKFMHFYICTMKDILDSSKK